MVTPPASITSPGPSDIGTERPAPTTAAQELSASPFLKEGKSLGHTMKRTPQPTFTQSKLTSMLQAAATGSQPGGPGNTGVVPAAKPALTTDQVEMDTSAPAQAPPRVAPPITEDFLLRSLKLNTEHIIKSFTSHVNMLSQRVDGNAARIAENASSIAGCVATAVEHKSELAALSGRVSELERSGTTRVDPVHRRVTLSAEYIFARRSIRLWPVRGDEEEALWENVGNFIHDTLRVSESEVSQRDIEDIRRTLDRPPTGVTDEVIVTLNDPRKHDLIMSHSVNLAECIDQEGRPTAGVRLEIPGELMDTFRLLSRFGTRLRARHGRGTKRHIKFDDFHGSLFTNIKLPGDETWTKITPDMAREDLDASVSEESAFARKRLASKLVPGPRERLRVPEPVLEPRLPGRVSTTRDQDARSAGPPGKRPRWLAPASRQL